MRVVLLAVPRKKVVAAIFDGQDVSAEHFDKEGVGKVGTSEVCPDHDGSIASFLPNSALE